MFLLLQCWKHSCCWEIMVSCCHFKEQCCHLQPCFNMSCKTPLTMSCKPPEADQPVICALSTSFTHPTWVCSSRWSIHQQLPGCSAPYPPPPPGGPAGPTEALVVSGGADSRLVLWRDATAAKAAEAEAAEEQLVLQQQELSNALTVSGTDD